MDFMQFVSEYIGLCACFMCVILVVSIVLGANLVVHDTLNKIK